MQEVYRRWERPLGNAALRAEVSFLILRDGTVREIRLDPASGSFSFDLAAQGAIEAAGTATAFGAAARRLSGRCAAGFLLLYAAFTQ